MTAVPARGLAALPDHRTSRIRAWALRAFFLLTWPVLVAPGWLRRRLHRGSAGLPKIYFFHIRKTAGTSFAKAFAALGGEVPLKVQRRLARTGISTWTGDQHLVHRGDSVVLRLSPYTFAWSHVPAWRFRVDPNVFTVTILRDPTARVLSLYNYLAHPESEAGEPFQAKPYTRSLAADGLDAFLRRVPRELLLNQLYMFSPILDPTEAAERIRALSAYFFTESYDLGTSTLSATLDLNLGNRSDRRSLRTAEPVEPAARALLADALAPEYELLALLRQDPGPGLIGGFPQTPADA